MNPHRPTGISLCLLWLAIVTVSLAQSCGPSGGTITIAGSSVVEPIVRKWAETYTKKCSDITITVERGTNSEDAAALRMCQADNNTTAVDIGTMARPWKSTEVTSINQNVNNSCLIGNTARKTIQLEVASDGIAVLVILGGLAAQCLRRTAGLTKAQLRWMFSNATEAVQGLTTPERIKAILPNSDGNETTKYWSELDASCPVANIRIAGPDSLSFTNELFRQVSGFDVGEGFATRSNGYVSGTNDEISRNLQMSSDQVYGDMIAYVRESYYYENGAIFYDVPIQNAAGAYVRPKEFNPETNPLSRRLYLQISDSPASLDHTKPFVQWGLSTAGLHQIDELGYQASSRFYYIDQLARLGLSGPDDTYMRTCPPGTAPLPTTSMEAGYWSDPAPCRIETVPDDDEYPLQGQTESCGLLGLSLFCFTGCGLLGRILGWCQS